MATPTLDHVKALVTNPTTFMRLRSLCNNLEMATINNREYLLRKCRQIRHHHGAHQLDGDALLAHYGIVGAGPYESLDIRVALPVLLDHYHDTYDVILEAVYKCVLTPTPQPVLPAICITQIDQITELAKSLKAIAINPPTVTLERAAIDLFIDSVDAEIKAGCSPDIPASALYTKFCTWCRTVSDIAPMSGPAFGKLMHEKVSVSRASAGNVYHMNKRI